MDKPADSSSHPFRDGTAGAEAKRLKLLRDRRDELATMSHEIRQIYVRRFSRLLASIALAIGGSIVVAASLDEDLANSIAGLLPGTNPAALSTALLATWVVAGFALFSGRAWAERRFAVAMAKAVLPTGELHTDVSRLAFEDPATVGRAITRRLVPLSRMVGLMASGLVLPLTGLAAYLVVKAGGYPMVDDVELLFAEQAGNLLLIGSMSVVFALRLGFTANYRPSFLTALGAAIFFPGVFFMAPSLMPAVLIGCALLGTTAYLTSRRRNKEDAKIEQEGAPVPPVVLFRKRLRQFGTALWSLTNLLRWSSWKSAGARGKLVAKRGLAFRPSLAQSMSVLVLAGAGAGMYLYANQSAESTTQAAGLSYSSVSNLGALDTSHKPVSYSTLRLSDDTLDRGATVDFNLVGGSSVDATEHLSDAYIPAGWAATISITKTEGDGRMHVEALDSVTEGPSTRQLSDSTPSVTFTRTNCSSDDVPLLFNVTPYGDQEGTESTATLHYEVQLYLVSGC